MSMNYLLLLGVCCWISGVIALPKGAPESACGNFTPSHSNHPFQKTPVPYDITAEKSGDKVLVTISSSTNLTFKGFILQARSTRDPTIFIDGDFTTTKNTKTLNCFNFTKGTLTHSNANPKSNITTEWSPNEDTSEGVTFIATIVESYDTFWSDVDSNSVTVHGVIPTTIGYEHSVYDNCNKTEGCFGLPEDCLADNSTGCEVLLRYFLSPDGVHFILHGAVDIDHYIALSFSNDSVEAERSRTTCLHKKDGVVINDLRSGAKKATILDAEVSNYTIEDSFITCEWKRPVGPEMNGTEYNFLNETFFLYIAKGTHPGNESYALTEEQVNITRFGLHNDVKAANYDLADTTLSKHSTATEHGIATTTITTTSAVPVTTEYTNGTTAVPSCSPALQFNIAFFYVLLGKAMLLTLV